MRTDAPAACSVESLERAPLLPRAGAATALESRSHRGILPTDVGRYVAAVPYHCPRLQGADEAIFVYCTTGHGWCQYGDQRLLVGPGELLIVPAGTPHECGADDTQPWSIYWVHLKGAQADDYLQSLEIVGQSPSTRRLGHDARLVSLFDELIEALSEGQDSESLVYGSNILRHLMSVLIRRHRDSTRPVPGACQRVSESIDYLKQHLAQPLDLKQLSQTAQLSPSHFSALFKRQTGHAPGEYLTRCRVHVASELLENTKLSVKAIAARVGYRDPLYFSRVFTALAGCSPTDYRQHRRTA